MHNDTTPLLSGRGLVKRYGQAHALDGVDIDIRTGEVLAIVGPSGSGKTSLLHVLAGIVPADEGQIVLAGQRIDRLSETRRSEMRRAEFGFVFQQGMLVGELTAEENVALPLLLGGSGRHEATAAAREWLDRLGLAGKERRRPGELSGGEAQRVAIARAIAHRPQVIFADEPTGALDTKTGQATVRALLASARSTGAAVVIVTHDREIAAAVPRTVSLRDGRIEPAAVSAETGLAAVAGAVLGVAASPLLHKAATFVPWDGGTWFADDFALSLVPVLLVAVAIPALVVGAAVAGLRRVLRRPLTATGGHTRKPLSVVRLLFVPAAAALFFWSVTEGAGGSVLPILVALAILMWSPTVVGPWVTSALGGIFVRVWRRPAALLAGRRLRDDPKAAYRASAGVVLAVFAGSMALTLMPSLEEEVGYYSQFREPVLYFATSGERAPAAVAAVDRRLDRYGVEERAVRVGQGDLRAGEEFYTAIVADCASARRVLPGTESITCRREPALYLGASVPVSGLGALPDPSAKPVPLPADAPVVTGAGTSDVVIVDPALWPANVPVPSEIVAVAASDATREAVRTALLAESGGEQVISKEMMLGQQHTQLADLRRVTIIGLATASVLAGLSAAIATAGSVLDRRRTFGALMAAGTPVRTLSRALRAEAALPALVATIGAGALGTAVGVALFGLVSKSLPTFSPWLAAPVVLGALVALLAASVCTPALKRVRAEPLADE